MGEQSGADVKLGRFLSLVLRHNPGAAGISLDGHGWAVEQIALSTHTGTHVDAPYHYHPTMNGGEPAWTVDEVPLDWFIGDGVVVDQAIEMEWSRIPHFYRHFYVYQYATGFSAAIALSKRILEGGEEAVKDYLRFLSGGCSTDPISLLKIAGVDMSTPQPVNDALALFGELIEELEGLLA